MKPFYVVISKTTGGLYANPTYNLSTAKALKTNSNGKGIIVKVSEGEEVPYEKAKGNS